MPIEREDGKTLTNIEEHIISIINEIGEYFHFYFWGANILKIVRKHILMLIIKKRLSVVKFGESTKSKNKVNINIINKNV